MSEFEVPGEPQPQGRPIFSSKTKTARDPDKSRNYKKLVRFYARRSKPPDILKGFKHHFSAGKETGIRIL